MLSSSTRQKAVNALRRNVSGVSGLFGIKELRNPEDWAKLSAEAIARSTLTLNAHNDIRNLLKQHLGWYVQLQYIQNVYNFPSLSRCKYLSGLIAQAEPSVETIRRLDEISDTVSMEP